MKLSQGLCLLSFLSLAGSSCGPKGFAKKDLSQGGQRFSSSDVTTSMEKPPAMPVPMPQSDPEMFEEEAMPPQVVSGASLSCSRTAVEDEIDCYLPNEKGAPASLPSQYSLTFQFLATGSLSKVLPLLAERRETDGTHFFISVKDLGLGRIVALMSKDGIVIPQAVFPFDLSTLETEKEAESALPPNIVEFSLSPQTHFGDVNIATEGDGCDPSLAAGSPGPTAGMKFRVEKKLTDAIVYLKGICGLQTSKASVSLLDANGAKKAETFIAAGTKDFVILRGDLEAGEYSLFIDSSASLLGDGSQDNFTIQGIGFTFSNQDRSSLGSFSRTN